jgi:hypothetical protein
MRLHPEHYFFGLILAGAVLGVALTLSGISPFWGFRIALGSFLIGWLPAIFALLFIAIPGWWRKR